MWWNGWEKTDLWNRERISVRLRLSGVVVTDTQNFSEAETV